eukprot:CAMPEP_0174738522 /NCGR_PEP_ID=MMETSP1094-20130205/70095_1 /TAXON_ID=156173 /ORGANISM="Chrysochromulina brevifilum, Strain UTEX LB 985" /LENGTH=122 /DNA_ID=CAMNT_0015941951 /DNA_START=39 /DNA_END=407 /DNA_ORIENTATION=+
MGIQINTMNGDTMEGMKACPGEPLGYVGEGKVMPMVGTQYDPKTFPLTDAVKAAGITEAEWDEICTSLSKGKGMTGIGGGFSKAIVAANEKFFDAKGLEATYAEYAKGQKCMIIYAKGTVPS